MERLKPFIKQMITSMPIIAIVGASFFPLRVGAQQALVLFSLLWFYVFMIFNVFGK